MTGLNQKTLDKLKVEAEVWLQEFMAKFAEAWNYGDIYGNEQPIDEPETGGGEVSEPVEEDGGDVQGEGW